MMKQIDKSQLYSRACTIAQTAIKEVVNAEQQDEQTLAFSLTECPLAPWVIAGAHSILIYGFNKTAVIGGVATGDGILVVRLPTNNDTLIRWSAPVFLKVKYGSAGFSFGKSKHTTFAVGMSSSSLNSLVQTNKGHPIAGLDVNFGCGTSIVERADVIAANGAGDINTLGVTKVSGMMLDFSFARGSLHVDQERHKGLYGDATPLQVLSGAVDAPPEMQPLYSELSLMIHMCERPSASPARVSASLERFSTGYNPDQVVVMENGQVMK
jgi:lipid-binding SYLF domain-containing protein